MRSGGGADRRGWRASTLIFVTLCLAGALLLASAALGALWSGTSSSALAVYCVTAVTAVLSAAALVLRAALVAPMAALADRLERGGEASAPFRLEDVRRLAAALEKRLAELRSEEREAASRRETAMRAELAAAEKEVLRTNAGLAALAQALARLSRGDFRTPLSDARPDGASAARLDQTVEMLARTILAFSASLGAIRDGAAEMKSSAERFGDEVATSAARAEAAIGAFATKAGAQPWAAPLAAAAARARELKTEASLHAATVGQGAVTFEEIVQTARDMGPILSLVDEVAFQTHFLALNAGVEAARLGPSGRGIAVVALELRVLSQRAKDAAKQSNGMLTRIAAEAGRGAGDFATLAPALEAIADRAAEIGGVAESAGANAQDRSAFTEAVGIMSAFVAQTRTAQRRLVDEVDAEASALHALVGKLRALIDRFQLSRDEDEPRYIAPPPQTFQPTKQLSSPRRRASGLQNNS